MPTAWLPCPGKVNARFAMMPPAASGSFGNVCRGKRRKSSAGLAEVHRTGIGAAEEDADAFARRGPIGTGKKRRQRRRAAGLDGDAQPVPQDRSGHRRSRRPRPAPRCRCNFCAMAKQSSPILGPPRLSAAIPPTGTSTGCPAPARRGASGRVPARRRRPSRRPQNTPPSRRSARRRRRRSAPYRAPAPAAAIRAPSSPAPSGFPAGRRRGRTARHCREPSPGSRRRRPCSARRRPRPRRHSDRIRSILAGVALAGT